ncbi:hypothetical protein JHK82_016433 [Glycine max]|nr:hypothetical protein JHK85_016847 [Glycine max]KAG5149552.1 hypothetical protein JHK82_016433 [Glycine max]
MKELAFPVGYAQDVDNLIKNQRQSYSRHRFRCLTKSITERVQSLIGNHKSWSVKNLHFEGIDRKSFDDGFKNNLVEVEKKEAEITHMEGKVAKQEQPLAKKAEKLKEKEIEYVKKEEKEADIF